MEKLEKVSTGFLELDGLLGGGLPISGLTILASRPGVGKTSFVLNIASNLALRQHIPVAIFSLDMSKGQLSQRILSQESEIDASKFNTYTLPREGFEKLANVMDIMAKAPMYFDDKFSSNIFDICGEARILKKSENYLGLIIVDYLQKIDGINSRKSDRLEELKVILHSLKNLSVELKLPIIVASQLSCSVEVRKDKHPILSDLKEINFIEKYADIVAFLYREDYYKDESEPHNGFAEITIAQNKTGALGSMTLQFVENIATFKNRA